MTEKKEHHILAGDLERGFPPGHFDRDEPEVEKEPESTDQDDSEAFLALKRQFDELKISNEEAAKRYEVESKRNQEMQAQLGQLRSSEMDAHKTLIEQAISTETMRKDAAKRRYREARDLGDIDEELKVQEELSDIEFTLRQLKSGQSELERMMKEPAKPAAETRSQAELEEEYIQKNIQDEPSRAWVREHQRDLFDNPARAELAQNSARVAELRGYRPGSDEYFAFVNEQMGYSSDEMPEDPETDDEFIEEQEPEPKKPAVKARSKPLPAAPVSRRSTVKKDAKYASKEVREIARALGMTPEKYLENQARIDAGEDVGVNLGSGLA